MGYTEGFAVAEVKAMAEAATVKGEAAREEAEAARDCLKFDVQGASILNLPHGAWGVGRV